LSDQIKLNILEKLNPAISLWKLHFYTPHL